MIATQQVVIRITAAGIQIKLPKFILLQILLMTFPFRRKIQFYSSKSKSRVLDEIENMLTGDDYTKAEAETISGNFVIRTTDRLLFF